MKTIKITQEDQYVWLLVTEKAKEIYLSGLFELYVLYDDDSETLVEGFTQLSEALENGLEIGIEVGQLNNTMEDIYYFDDWVRYMLNNSDYSEFELLEFEEYYQNLLPFDKNLELFLEKN